MDFKSILRSFYLHQIALDEEQPEVTCSELIMTSYIPGEYGAAICRCSAILDSEPYSLSFVFTKTSGASPYFLSLVREHEIRFFGSSIVPLFYPQTDLPDGLQETLKETQDLS